jgi:hypothetical protein
VRLALDQMDCTYIEMRSTRALGHQQVNRRAATGRVVCTTVFAGVSPESYKVTTYEWIVRRTRVQDGSQSGHSTDLHWKA